MHRSHGLIVVAAVAALLSLGPGLGSSRIRGEEPRNPPAGTIDQAGPRKLALLVGISQYERAKDPPQQPPDWWNLHCQNDVDLLKKALLERFSFPEGDIRVLTDAAATRQGIVDAFRDHLISEGQSQGLWSISTTPAMGSRYADDNGDEIDGLDESLVTADYKSQSAQDGAATNLRDDTIGELLRAAQDPDGRPGRRPVQGEHHGHLRLLLLRDRDAGRAAERTADAPGPRVE